MRSVTVLLAMLLASLLCTAGEPNKSEEALKKAAGYGNSQAQTDLGILYLRPDMRESHGEEAKKWFMRAAASDYAPAEFNLGVMYLRGWGTPVDSSESARWFRKAGNHGMQSAYAYMGLLLLRSSNHAEQEEGFSSIRKAAKDGDSVAMNSLGYCYDIGLGTEPDIANAVKWYKRAAKKNDKGALHNLAKLYRVGYGVPRDEKEANSLDSRACSAGNMFACREIETSDTTVANNGVQNKRQSEAGDLLGILGQPTSSPANALTQQRKPMAAEAERWKYPE